MEYIGYQFVTEPAPDGYRNRPWWVLKSHVTLIPDETHSGARVDIAKQYRPEWSAEGPK